MQHLIDKDTRRAVLTLLAYDSDYTLSDSLLVSALESLGKNVTFDQLRNQLTWLAENGFVSVKQTAGMTMASLTDRGLEIARGKSRAVGVRDLRPSEIADINAGR